MENFGLIDRMTELNPYFYESKNEFNLNINNIKELLGSERGIDIPNSIKPICNMVKFENICIRQKCFTSKTLLQKFVWQYKENYSAGIKNLLFKAKYICEFCRDSIIAEVNLLEYYLPRLTIKFHLHKNCDKCVLGIIDFTDLHNFQGHIDFYLDDEYLYITPRHRISNDIRTLNLDGYLDLDTLRKLFIHENSNERVSFKINNLDIPYLLSETSDDIPDNILIIYSRRVIFNIYGYFDDDIWLYDIITSCVKRRLLRVTSSLINTTNSICLYTDDKKAFAQKTNPVVKQTILEIEAIAEYELGRHKNSEHIQYFPNYIIDIIKSYGIHDFLFDKEGCLNKK